MSYTWDANGNLTSKADSAGTTTYRYDGDNRLLEVQRGGGTIARLTYDPFGRRVSKTTTAGTVYFVYDGQDLLAEIDAAGNLLSYYISGPGIDEPLALVRGQQIYFHHADALGTITHLTNQSGLVIQSYEYDGFGKILQQTGSLNQAYTFTGREWDAEIELYYYRSRYYDPLLGRFTSEDPLGQAVGVNLYAYVRNNPTALRDPFGLFPIIDAGRYGCGGGIFVHYYREMRRRNWIGGDAYFHCMASCQATRWCGADVSFNIGLIREITDWVRSGKWNEDDVRNNLFGIRCPRDRSCEDRCRPLAPIGMPVP